MAFSSGNSGGPMADINVTPLVDVMLVLLIIFIITAPLMSHKVKVELPQANLKQDPDKDEKRSNPITLSVKEDGSLYWNDEPVSKETLESRFSTAAQQTPQPPLNLRGDRTTKMRTINEITKIAQGQGMLDVGFVATKEKGN
ncbi:biopolymer transporter ExbD [Xanthomonas translucens pv. arrhenatheri]|uniref:Biopolymer transport protein exbD1 n=1 Tax=Xanthomonas graminis pv. arrhenatheri LMG 727 TaxID=1195923 RepID=A0A0K3A5E2_9XANT|nr:biopolymer transporter ExbD [Xanthomonas translucens]OAX66170.1 biopolymer transporter ExbD [Xanthomonas translucens pv. arrhenatheri]UKE77702.1 biopolymer transporter ExbD [Xanthomonas translucens pv. arrhenatheri]CTP90740.1 Biopolymer transport protein exbD1 [Xanthomonas translucens pv. arrhenatheri LMG 727]